MKRSFRIDENARNRGGEPLVLIDDTDTVVRVGDSVRLLVDLALEELGATEVIHADERWEPKS